MLKYCRSNGGFTLIEVIISLVILTIVMVAFLSIFSTGLIGIYGAGDKGIAYSEAQADLGSRIGTGEDAVAEDLVLVFSGVSHTIPGGMIESFRQEQGRSSTLETYIPYLPSITLNPAVVFEGTSHPTQILVTGYNTNFSSTNSHIDIYDKTGELKLFGPITPAVASATSATFIMPANLLNSKGHYIVQMKTAISGQPDQISRARYIVEQPKIIAAGEGALYVSENSTYWLDRPSAEAAFPAFNLINAACFGSNRYVAVGSSGTEGIVLSSANESNWTKTPVYATRGLKDVTWSSNLARFYAVGLNGTIFYSANSLLWIAISSGTNENLNGISVTDSGHLVIVGDKGTIITVTSGVAIAYINSPVSADLLDVVNNHTSDGKYDKFLAVGKNSTIISSVDGSAWTVDGPPDPVADDLNGITYHNRKFVIVGNLGRILVYDEITGAWTNYKVGNKNLHSVFGVDGRYIAVGEGGAILTSTDTSLWTAYSGAVSGVLRAVTGR